MPQLKRKSDITPRNVISFFRDINEASLSSEDDEPEEVIKKTVTVTKEETKKTTKIEVETRETNSLDP